jgi:cytidylate kinase
MIVAIDGPAGAGKSTVARLLAERLRFRYLDTGAMYRALTWLAIREGIELGDGERLGALARQEPVELDSAGRVSIAGADVTTSIRQARIDKMVPVVARHPQVREVMRARQRELADQGDAVMEGRDIGTVVCPSADLKVYLTADPAVRAARRQVERPDVGADALATDLRLRDQRDAERMQPAEDAVEIDTTDLQADQVVDRIEDLIRTRAPR